MTPIIEIDGVVLYDPERDRVTGAIMAQASIYTKEAADQVKQYFMAADSRDRYQVRRAKLTVYDEEVTT